MVRLLAAGREHAPAHRTDLCLRCHGASPPNVVEPLSPTSEFHRTANCENCHGAAGGWLTDHYSRDWKGLSDSEKSARGLVPTKNLAARVKLCAGCHVGEPGREVDHKLIAAGHPALRFEFAGFQAEPVYTRHWREGNDEARIWAIGQVGSARAAVELLRHRASGAAGRDWPELAEHTCFACHQGLTGTPSAVSGTRSNPTRPGMLPWGSWYYPMVAKMADGSMGAWCRPAETQTGLSAMAELFHRTDRPAPTAVEKEAARSVMELDRWLVQLQSGEAPRADELRSSLRAAVRTSGDVPRSGAPSTDWDRYTQGFLATAALYRASCAVDPSTRDMASERDLRALASELRFIDAQTDSPRKWSAAETEQFQSRWTRLTDRFVSGGRP